MPGRKIEIALESLSGNATRVRAVASLGFMRYDTATADEIIKQTEKSIIGLASR